MRFLPILLCAALCAAADNAAVDAYKKAMAGDNAYDKRDAIKALADKSIDDDTALPLLVQAVGDRQGHDPAVLALRARTGLTPPSRHGGSRYPGYPESDEAAAWQAWLADRAKDLALKKKIDNLEKKDAGVGKGTTPTDTPAETPAPTAEAAPRIPTDDLGKVDRIVYKSGRSLIAYVRSKRLDADGNLVSVRVVHRNGAGEEVIDASTIARIEEDIE